METIKGKYRRKVTDVNTIFYINPEGIKITVFSPFELILKELITLGIDPIETTISDLHYQVSEIFFKDLIDLTLGITQYTRQQNLQKQNFTKRIL